MHDAFLGTRNVLMVSNLCHQVAAGYHCPASAPAGGGLAAGLRCSACQAVVSREEGHRAKGKTKADSLSKSRPEVSEVFLSAKQTPACMCDSDSCCFLLQTCAGGAAFNILLSAGYRPNLEKQQGGENASGCCLLKWTRRDQPVKCSEGSSFIYCHFCKQS